MYDEYAARIRKRYRAQKAFGDWVKTHRALICVCAVLVAAAVFALLFFAGSYLNTLTSRKGVYGEVGVASTRAFLSDVDYTVSELVAGSSAEPLALSDGGVLPVGEYSVEARTVNPFGLVRTQEARIQVEKRPLVLEIADFSVTYGETTDVREFASADGLVPGDRIGTLEVRWNEFAGESEAEVTAFTVLDPDGRDMTYCYELTLKPGTVTVLPRPLTVGTGSGKKIFDRAPLRVDEYELVDGSLAAGDELRVEFGSGVTEPGVYPNQAELSVWRGEQDVSFCYLMTLEPGSLEVERIRLTLSSPDYKKEYDGSEYVNTEYALVDGALLAGDELTVSGRAFTAAGVYENTVSARVIESGGADVTDHYAIEYRPGTVEITKRPITFRSTDGPDTVYDGEPRSYREAWLESGSLAEGDRAQYTNFASEYTAGNHSNRFAVEIFNSRGDNVTDNYDITRKNGTFRITKRKLTLVVTYGNVLPERQLVTVSHHGVVEGSFAPTDYPQFSDIPLSTPFDQYQDQARAEIYAIANNTRRTANYDLKLIVRYEQERIEEYTEGSDGTSPSKDALPSTPILTGEISMEPETGLPGLIAGYVSSMRRGQIYLRLRSYGDYNGKGWNVAPEFSSNTTGLNAPLSQTYNTLRQLSYFSNNSVMVKDLAEDGLLPVPYFTEVNNDFRVDETAVYCITDEERRYSQITLMDTEVLVHLDGEPLSVPGYTAFVYRTYTKLPKELAAELKSLAAESGLTQYSGEPLELIVKVQEFIRNRGVYNSGFQPIPAGADPILFFLNESREGICNHYASAAVAMYRALGIPARYTVGYLVTVVEAEKSTPYTASEAHAWVEVYVDKVGWVPVEVTSTNVVDHGDDADWEDFAHVDDDNQIPYNMLLFYMENKEKEYDGTPLYSDEPVIVLEGVLKPGHKLYAVTEGFTYTGTYQARATDPRVYDANGEDVTDQYEVLELAPCELTICTASITLEPLTFYVGQEIRLADLYGGSSAQTAALVGDAEPAYRMVIIGDRLIVDSDGVPGVSDGRDMEETLLWTYAGIALVFERYNFGSEPGSDGIDLDEVNVMRDINIVSFTNVVVFTEPLAPAERAELEPGTLVTVTGANGKAYTHLVICGQDAEKAFDGEYLVADGFVLAGGALKPGHRIDFMAGGSQLYVGESLVTPKALRVLDEAGRDVTGEYMIYYYPGTLRVTPGSYPVDALELELTVDETEELSGLRWHDGVDGIPVRYTAPESSAAVLTGTGAVTGVNPGTLILDAQLGSVDLNGDGTAELLPAHGSVTVNVKAAKRNGSPGLVLSFAALIALGIGLILAVMISYYKVSGADPKREGQEQA